MTANSNTPGWQMADEDQQVGLSKVVKASQDGRLLASTFSVTTCDNCPAAHFAMLGDDEKEFAVAMIPPEYFRPLASLFIQMALIQEAKQPTKGMH